MTDTNDKVFAVNQQLEEGEPGNISYDSYAKMTGYKPQTIIDAMNHVFGTGNWGFEEVETIVTPNLIETKVEVWLIGVEWHPKAWGQARITKGDEGDARKGAQTDAIKKGLSYFSVGKRAYLGLLPVPREDIPPATVATTARPTTQQQPASRPTTQQQQQKQAQTSKPASHQPQAPVPPPPVVEEPGVELTEEVEALLARYMKLGKHERRAFLQKQSMDPELDLRRGFEWNPESYNLFRGRLDEWITSPERKEWCAGQITDEQLHEITAAQDPASIVSRFKGLFGTLKEAQAQLFVIRDLDNKMHGKSFREFSAGMADRFIYYVEQGKKESLSPHYTVTIPEKYRYKEPGTTTEQEQQKGAA